MANWQGNIVYNIPSIPQISSIAGRVSTIEYDVSTLFNLSAPVSSLSGRVSTLETFFGDLSGGIFVVNELVTDLVSSSVAQVPLLQTSTVSIVNITSQPSFSLFKSLFTVDLGLGQAIGGLLGGIGGAVGGGVIAAGTGAGLAIQGLEQGWGTVMAGRPKNFINQSTFEVLNFTTQLQVSTIGNAYPLYSTIFRTVSSVAANQVPGREIFTSTFFLPGTTCIRSISDPFNLMTGDSNLNTSTLQAFGEWTPIDISGGGGGGYTPTPNFSNVLITYENEPGLAIGKIDDVNISTGYATLPPSVQVPELFTLSSFHNHYSAVSQYNLYQTTFSTGDVNVNYADTFSTITNFQMLTGFYDTYMISQLTDDFLQQKQLAGLNFQASTIGFGVSSFQTLTGRAPIQFQMDTQFNCNVIVSNLSTTNITVGNNIFGSNAYFTGQITASSLNILQTISTILTDTDLLNVSTLNAERISSGVISLSSMTANFISCGTAEISTLTIGTTVFDDLVGSNVYIDDVLRFKNPNSAQNVQYDWLFDYAGGSATSNLLLTYLSSSYTDLNILSINGQSNFVGIGKTPNVALDVIGSVSTTGNLATQNINSQTITGTTFNSIGNNNFNAIYSGGGTMSVFDSLRTTTLPLQQVQVANVSCNNPNYQWNFYSTNIVEWTSTVCSVITITTLVNQVVFWDMPNAQIDLQNNTSAGIQVNTRNTGGTFTTLVIPANFPSGSRYRITLSPTGASALLNPPQQSIPYTNNLSISCDQQNYYIADTGTTYPNNGLYITPPLYLQNVQQFGARARLVDVNSISGFTYINTGFLPFQISASANFGGGVVTAQTTANITVQLIPPGGGTQPSTFAFYANDWLPILLPYSQDSSITSPAFNSLQMYPQSSGGSRPIWQAYLRTVLNTFGGSMNWTVGGYMIPRTLGTYSWS
jgi:hypothetical protein